MNLSGYFVNSDGLDMYMKHVYLPTIIRIVRDGTYLDIGLEEYNKLSEKDLRGLLLLESMKHVVDMFSDGKLYWKQFCGIWNVIRR